MNQEAKKFKKKTRSESRTATIDAFKAHHQNSTVFTFYIIINSQILHFIYLDMHVHTNI